MTDAPDNNVRVSCSPHLCGNRTTRRIMIDVSIALLPACGMGIYTFGIRALAVLVLCVASCVMSEFLFCLLMHKEQTVGDWSAVVTGLILGVNLPASVPLWLPLLGGAFAMVIVKLLFGGIGQNFMNPALAARCFLLISFAGIMTAFPATYRTILPNATDAVSSATPLAAVRAGENPDWLRMLLDTHNGCIGESSPIAIAVGALYLLIRRVITPRIPLIYLGSTIGLIALFQVFSGSGAFLTPGYLVAQLCGGGLLIGASFMANDYTTSPITPWGQVLYALLLGLLTSLFRVFGSAAEGVSYAIIIGNCVVPLIESVTQPVPLTGRHGKGGKKG